MKYRAVIEGIDPTPSRVLQSSGQYIEGCRVWAKCNLEQLTNHPNRVAIIYECVEKEVERIRPEGPTVELKDEIVRLIEDLGTATKVQEGGMMNDAQDGPYVVPKTWTVEEISQRLMEALDRVSGK